VLATDIISEHDKNHSLLFHFLIPHVTRSRT